MTRRRPARDLRTAIDCLPLQTRKAMLEGVEVNRIIVGAYTDRQGGVCPMLAAHRNGGGTNPAPFAPGRGRHTGGAPRAGPGPPRPAPSYPLGWSWLRPFRRLDEYQRALAELDLAVAGPDELELGHDAVAGS